MRNGFRAALIASCGKSLLANGVDENIKTLISLLDGVQVPSYCYENPSVKRQQIAAKKVYSIDTGLSNAIGFTFSPNTGKLLENLVFLALRRKSREIYYYTTPAGYEVDFYLPETHQLIRVAQSMDHPATREREMRALVDAMGALGVSSGLVLTDTRSNEITENGFTIQIRSLSEWLLER